MCCLAGCTQPPLSAAVSGGVGKDVGHHRIVRPETRARPPPMARGTLGRAEPDRMVTASGSRRLQESEAVQRPRDAAASAAHADGADGQSVRLGTRAEKREGRFRERQGTAKRRVSHGRYLQRIQVVVRPPLGAPTPVVAALQGGSPHAAVLPGSSLAQARDLGKSPTHLTCRIG